jgi:hypothetical protein
MRQHAMNERKPIGGRMFRRPAAKGEPPAGAFNSPDIRAAEARLASGYMHFRSVKTEVGERCDQSWQASEQG